MRIYFALGIAALWLVSYVVSIAQSNFIGFEVSTPIMAIAAGFLLHSGMRNGNGHD